MDLESIIDEGLDICISKLQEKAESNEYLNKLKELFPRNEKLWIKYKNQRLKQFDNKEIDIYVIEEDEKIIGELTVDYISHDLESETIPNIRVYFKH